MMEVVKYGDERLSKKCETIKEFNEELKDISEQMFESMYEHNGVGLAGPQVGITKRIVVIDTRSKEEDEESEESDKPSKIVMINPKILAYSPNEVDMQEGCLSVPGVYAKVKRPVKIKVKYNELDGKEITMRVRGFLARVMQHEIDHTNGILFVEKVSKEDFAEIEPDLELIKQGKPIRQKVTRENVSV